MKLPWKTAEKPAREPTPACVAMLPTEAPVPSRTISVNGRALPKITSGRFCVKAGCWVAGVVKASHPEGHEEAVKNCALTAVVVIGFVGFTQKTESELVPAVTVSAPRTVPV